MSIRPPHMKNKIHYEDDLFYLNLQMKLLREGFQLSIDSDYFLDKIVFDLRFVDSGLGRILSTLKENTSLIRRSEYFHNLIKVETVFVELLEEILSQKYPFCEYLVSFFGELRQRQDSHRQDVAEIRTLQRRSTVEEEDKEDFITADEMQLLIRPDPEED
jgi:hypothetical protein